MCLATNFHPIDGRLVNAYKDMALHIFNNDANGVINPINRNCHLSLDNYDFVTNTYGGFIYPSTVELFVCGIIETSAYMKEVYKTHGDRDLHDMATTGILFTILHEVSHSDQNINMGLYNTDSQYMQFVEAINDTRTVLYMLINREYFEKKYVFTYNFNIIEIPGSILTYFNYSKEQLVESYNRITQSYYFKNFEDLYRCYLSNLFQNDEVSSMVMDYNSILIRFTNPEMSTVDDFLIKEMGEYRDPVPFSEGLHKWIKRFDYSKYAYKLDKVAKKDNWFLAVTFVVKEVYYSMKVGD